MTIRTLFAAAALLAAAVTPALAQAATTLS